MNGKSIKDPVTEVIAMDKTTSIIRILKGCSDFKNEQTQLMYIMDLLGARLTLTPKCHPEIAVRGVEYAWGYGKLRFHRNFNDAIAKNLNNNVRRSLANDVIPINRL